MRTLLKFGRYATAVGVLAAALMATQAEAKVRTPERDFTPPAARGARNPDDPRGDRGSLVGRIARFVIKQLSNDLIGPRP